jgi:hypothetical protein
MWVVIFLMGGIVARATNGLAPLHELGHLLAAWSQGINAWMTAWNVTQIEKLTVRVVYGGHWFELIVWSFFIVLLMSRKVAFFFLDCPRSCNRQR